MQLLICAVGRLKAGPETALLDDYLERVRNLGRSAGVNGVTVREIAESRAGTARQRRDDEAERLLALIPDGALAVALDETGKAMTSREFAGHVGKAADDGIPHMAFCIGGPDGHGKSLRQRAGLTVAFGRLTWPHRLIRLMLAEQIYRAVTILVNHPYHRD